MIAFGTGNYWILWKCHAHYTVHVTNSFVCLLCVSSSYRQQRCLVLVTRPHWPVVIWQPMRHPTRLRPCYQSSHPPPSYWPPAYTRTTNSPCSSMGNSHYCLIISLHQFQFSSAVCSTVPLFPIRRCCIKLRHLIILVKWLNLHCINF